MYFIAEMKSANRSCKRHENYFFVVIYIRTFDHGKIWKYLNLIDTLARWVKPSLVQQSVLTKRERNRFKPHSCSFGLGLAMITKTTENASHPNEEIIDLIFSRINC